MADLCSDQATVTPWWLLVLVEELPDTSAFAASLRGGHEYRGWGWDRHIAAALFDAIQIQSTIVAKVGGAKNVKTPPPLPRPGQQDKSAGTPMSSLMRAHGQMARAVAKMDKAQRGE